MPLVTSSKVLAIYPCLRDAPLHSGVNNHDSECQSIQAAAVLSEAEVREMRLEVRRCAEELYKGGMELLGTLGVEAMERRALL